MACLLGEIDIDEHYLWIDFAPNYFIPFTLFTPCSPKSPHSILMLLYQGLLIRIYKAAEMVHLCKEAG